MAEACLAHEQACTLGEAASCARLGVLLTLGERVPKDLANAERFLRKACHAGRGEACRELGTLLSQGVRPPTNKAAVRMLLYRHACALDDALGCLRYGEAFERQGNDHSPVRCLSEEEQAFRKYERRAASQEGNAYLEKACALGSQDGCVKRLRLDTKEAEHSLGRLIAKDLPAHAAVSLLRRACELRHASSCALLADAYHQGWSVPRDSHAAWMFRIKACSLHHSESCSATARVLGFLLRLAVGHAFCAAGNVPVCLTLASTYDTGQWVKKDRAYATRLIGMACVAGDLDACTNVAERWDVGIGVSRNRDLALYYYRRAKGPKASLPTRWHIGGGGFGIGKYVSRRPEVFMARACVTGGLDAATIREVIRANLRRTAPCFEDWPVPRRMVRIYVTFDIDQDGSVQNVNTKPHDAEPAIGRCLINVFKQFVFPRPEGSMPFVSYPVENEYGE